MNIDELLAHPDICGIATTGTPVTFLMLLTAGLLAGFSHCMGMCGPLVGSFVMHQRKYKADVTSSLLTFQLGRLSTYLLLGLVAGTVGSLVRFTVVAHGWQSRMSILVGILMLIAAVNLLGWWPVRLRIVPLRLIRGVSARIRFFMGVQHPAANFALGMCNGLLPCAPVYTMLLLAVTLGNPLYSALAMFTFGLGTLPAMLGVGLFASQLSIRLRTHLYKVGALLVLFVGIQLTLRGLALADYVSHLSVAGVMIW